jgi:hypothetical protein
MSWNGLALALRKEAMAEVFMLSVPDYHLVIHHRSQQS